jgi:hypothetical protein
MFKTCGLWKYRLKNNDLGKTGNVENALNVECGDDVKLEEYHET